MKFLNSNRGQGLVEYLILVALMGVATIGVVRVCNQVLTTRFAKVAMAIQGKNDSVENVDVNKSLYKKRDLGDFFEGAATR